MSVCGGEYPPREENKATFGLRDPLILGVVVFCACLFGIYSRPVGFLATVWPANAIMLSFLLLRPNSARVSGWLAAVSAYLAADLLTGSTLPKAVLLNLANLVGVVTAYFICIRLPVDAIRLRQPSSMLYIALVSAAGASAVGAVGAIANPILFGGGSISGSLFWFATEFVNYLTILPVILSWPFNRVTPEKSGMTELKEMAASLAAHSGLPVAALVLSCLAAMIIGGPGAIAFPVPALLWCGLIYPVFPTAILTLLFGSWALIAISAGYLPNSTGPIDEMSLVSIRLGASLIALAPVTLATVMQSRNKTEAALNQSNLRFHIITESIPQIVWSTDAYGHHDYFNRRWKEFTGTEADATNPEGWKTLVHTDDRPLVDKAWLESLASGKPYDIDYRLRHHDGKYRWVKVLAKPIRDTDGNITRWYGTSTDIDDAKHLELERELVAYELDHRIKNLFALVGGLVSLSVREEPALRPLVEPLSARLTALHQAHGLIHGKSGSRTGTLQALLWQLLSPYEQPEAGNIAIVGMDIAINIAAFKSMALVVHELITNAAKYGALSQKDGKLQVSLHVGEERLTITWEELFSGKLDTEQKSGFGSKLLNAVVETQLRGSLSQNLRPDGLSVVISLPRTAIEASRHLDPDSSAQEP